MKSIKNLRQIYCPVCNEQLQEHTVKNEQCCKTMKLETDNGEIVRVSCYLIQRCKYVNDLRLMATVKEWWTSISF